MLLIDKPISISQVYQQGFYVKTLSGNICKNNGLEWSSDKTESLRNFYLLICNLENSKAESQQVEKFIGSSKICIDVYL